MKHQMNIGYIRVSTARQGESGLGLDAQLAMLDIYARTNGPIIQTYVEIESGGNPDRPILAAAIAHVRRVAGRLVVAKQDRLARDIELIARLTREGLDWIACDGTGDNSMTKGIKAVMDQEERERISNRTKAALAVLKARGVPLGSARPGHWTGREHLRRAGFDKARAITHKRYADRRAATYGAPTLIATMLRQAGHTLQQIADKLNQQGIKTVKNCGWHKAQVRQLLTSTASQRTPAPSSATPAAMYPASPTSNQTLLP